MVDPILSDDDVAVLRADAESQMADTIAFRRPTGRAPLNENTGLEAPTTAHLFTTMGEVRGRGASDAVVRVVTIGGVEHPVIDAGLKIPVDTPVLQRGDEGVVTAVGPNTDPTTLNRIYKVIGVSGRSWAIFRALDVVEV